MVVFKGVVKAVNYIGRGRIEIKSSTIAGRVSAEQIPVHCCCAGVILGDIQCSAFRIGDIVTGEGVIYDINISHVCFQVGSPAILLCGV